MEKIKYHPFTKAAFILLFFSILAVGCSKSKVGPDQPEPEPPISGIKIIEIAVPTSITTDYKTEIKISGKGFVQGDEIMLTSTKDLSLIYNSTVKQVLADGITFIIPNDFPEGSYKLTLKRKDDYLYLASTTIDIIFNVNIPDKTGMTIKGVIHAQGIGLANVVVSDGVEVTKTDSDGIYYLPSKKENHYVFVSIPGNYEVDNNGSAPLFYKTLTKAANQVEIKDFKLTPVDNNKHVVLAMADLHLANRNDDISQFEKGFMPDVNSVIQTYKNSGIKIYGLTLGDLTWDLYWYSNSYFLSDYLTQMNKINAPVFNVIGNHDNDPYVAGDLLSEGAYRKIIGPTYYSFNLGKIHYVVLDNVEYINADGMFEKEGARDYKGKIISSQMEWLKKDLAMIEDKSTPIIVGMHIQLNNNPTLSAGKPVSTLRLDNSAEFKAAFTEFSNVNVLTGHTHINYAVDNATGTFMEHNTAAVCATWWWTGKNGYAGNHIAKDGSPGGYAIWEFNNKDVKWQYKGIGESRDYQFRAYDLNKTHITAAAFAPASTDTKLSLYTRGYGTANNNNEILINVWGYDEKWKVEVTENGTPLTVTRVSAYDPLHIISYEAKRVNADAVPTDDFVSTATAHIFKAKASNATNTLQIKVTDRFGKVYTENMIRPKALTYLMK
ncbi:MAG: calcineurin-like phosphoesterase family protein [Pedobacter sp.]|uniref:calcineurin-like phosphoesterase C-terminal domain-containing protein n=1 Tax=Pedobacter sp. TaxID=1411316 RepID=UPI00356A695A